MFAAAEDYRRYLDCALHATHHHGVAVHAYVLMSNHVHMLMTPGDTTAIPRAMHWLGSVFVRDINERYGRTGSRVEGRYKARSIRDDAHLIACMRYIESNPVRAGMTPSAAQYPWSSFACNVSGARDALVSPHPLYNMLGASDTDRRSAYLSPFDQMPDDVTLEAIRMSAPQRGRHPTSKGTAAPSTVSGVPLPSSGRSGTGDESPRAHAASA